MYLSKRSNKKYYIFFKQQNGKFTCKSTGTKSKSEALKYLTNFEKELKERFSKKVTPILVSHFVIEFLSYSETVYSWNHTLSLRTTCRAFADFVGNILLSDLEKKNVTEFIQNRSKNVSAYTVRRDIADLSTAFNYAISKKYLNENFMKGIKKPKITEKLPLFSSTVEFELLLKVIDDDDMKGLVIFALNTGLRQSDVVNLEWRQINFQNQTLLLDNRNSQTKLRKVHTIPLNVKALQILTDRQIKYRETEKVFTYQGKPIKALFLSHKFKKYVKRAPINQQLTFHSLRHTFASLLVQRGVSIYQVSRLLTHSDIRVTQIYSHLTEQDLLKAVNQLNN